MKPKRKSDVQEAGILFAAKKYSQVISLLSPQIFLYRKEPRFHKLLGFSCLYTGDFGGAYSYFQRAKDLDNQDIEAMLGLALVMLRRRKTTEALRLWLEVLDVDPENKRAKKALNMAKLLAEEDWLEIIEDKKYAAILPPHPRLISRIIKRFAAVIVITSILSLGAVLILREILDPGEYRQGQELLSFSVEDYSQGDYSRFATIILSDQELEREMQQIERYFRQYRDNLVRYRGNRILMSNAPLEVKDRIALLLNQLSAPDFTNFADGFEYSEVEEDPALHHGVYIRWRGRVANVIIQDDLISFDLLVGFESGRVVEGRVPVSIDFPVSLAGGESVELIGRISTRDDEIRIQGSSMRRIRSSE